MHVAKRYMCMGPLCCSHHASAHAPVGSSATSRTTAASSITLRGLPCACCRGMAVSRLRLPGELKWVSGSCEIQVACRTSAMAYGAPACEHESVMCRKYAMWDNGNTRTPLDQLTIRGGSLTFTLPYRLLFSRPKSSILPCLRRRNSQKWPFAPKETSKLRIISTARPLLRCKLPPLLTMHDRSV